MNLSGLYDQHEKHFVALDCIIFGFDQKDLNILLIKRGFEPEKGKWSLMGGFLRADESLDQAAARILEELTGLTGVYMEQLYAYGAVGRDPVARTVSVAYYALIKTEHYDRRLGDSHNAQWFPVSAVPPLILDHEQMVQRALDQLQEKSRTQPVGFELLPEKFTMPQLKSLYEAINDREYDSRNFSKKIATMEWIVKLDEKDKSTSRKGAYYFRFDKDRYRKLLAEGVDFQF
jgi:ADP-ribose pyrophosphatase YjhB (NUDIX family)